VGATARQSSAAPSALTTAGRARGEATIDGDDAAVDSNGKWMRTITRQTVEKAPA
jgi:hypothetical protein